MSTPAIDHIRQRVEELEDEIGGVSKPETKLPIVFAGKRHTSGPQRPILSLIRGLDIAMKKLEGYAQLERLERLVKEYDNFKHFIESSTSAIGVLNEMKAKAVAIAEQTQSISDTSKMLSELKDYSNVLKKELPLDHSQFDTALIRAESLMSMQLERAAELQVRTEELMESYNFIIQTITRKLLHWDAMVNKWSVERLNSPS
mmetsp:Transcript_3113/g.5883  ORF Transcript_3113/g.5883 Transcript_3113/m.5883 type:complete len:202 (-) Transcript_3113:139-744(-)